MSDHEIDDKQLNDVSGGGEWTEQKSDMIGKFSSGDRVRTRRGNTGTVISSEPVHTYFSGTNDGYEIRYQVLLDDGNKQRLPEHDLTEI